MTHGEAGEKDRIDVDYCHEKEGARSFFYLVFNEIVDDSRR